MKTLYKLVLITFLLISSSTFAQTTYSWNGGNGNWSVAANWSPNGVPTSIDNVVITTAGTYTVTLDGDSTINDLTIGGISGIQSLSLSSRTLTINGTGTINNNGSVSLTSSTLTGSGSLSNIGSISINQSNIDLNFDNSGLINFWRGCNINGSFTTQTNSIIRLRTAYATSSRPTFANGFTNNGLIEFITSYTSTAGRLDITSGILVNAAGGTIHAPSTGSHINHLNAPLDNQGTIILDRSITINKASAVHSNSGTISINNGTLTLTQSGTSPSFTTNGIVTVESTGTLAINGGSFDYISGTFTLDGSFSATNAIVDMHSSFNTIVNNFTLDNSTLTCTSSLTNQGNMSLTGSMLYGINDLINQSNLNLTSSTIDSFATLTNSGTMTVNNSTIDVDFDNDGSASFARASYINNALTTQSNSIIRMSSAYAAGAYLTIANGFTNNGLIDYTTSYTSTAGRLDITSGILVNAAGGTIHGPSTGSHINYLNAPLDNQGTIILDRSITINKASAVHSNSGTISINNGTLTLTQSGTSPSFTNTGIMTVDSTTALTINGGSFDYSSGTFTQNGSLTATNVAFTFTPAFANAMNMSLTNSTLSCASSFTNQNALTLTSSTINGSGSVTNSGTMSVSNSTFDIDFDNGGLANFWNSCNINDTFTTQTNSTIRLRTAYAAGAYLTIANGFTNNGLIDYTTSYYNTVGTLDVSSGILVNAAGGTIHTPLAASYNNNLYAPLYNQGTLLLERRMTINKASAMHINTSSITTIASLLTFTGASFENRVAGSLNGSGTIDVSNITFTNAGTINPGTSAGALNITGDLPQDTSSVINIELGGTIVGSSYDQLNVSGQAMLDGTLNISLIDNFIPEVGDIFDIITFNSKSDASFRVNGLYTGTGVLFDLISNSTSLQLVTTSAPNHPPIVSNQLNELFLDEDFGTSWVAHLDSVFDDSDISLGDSLTYEVIIEGNALSGAIINQELYIYSVSDSNGVVPVVVTATDMSSLSVSDTFDVAIIPVNDPPSVFGLLEPHHQVVLTSADTINFKWQSSLDVDDDPLNYELRIFGVSLDTTINNIADTIFQCIDRDIWQLDTEYKWTVSVSDERTSTASPDSFSFTLAIIDAISENNQLAPKVFALDQNYPNPFNPSTTIEYQLPATSQVELSIYNTLGQKVVTIVSKKQPVGTYKVKWNGTGFVSGVYFYRLSAQGTNQNFIQTKKLVLLK